MPIENTTKRFRRKLKLGMPLSDVVYITIISAASIIGCIILLMILREYLLNHK